MSNIIENLRKKFNEHNIDGYVIPKNDEYFSEYSSKDRLKAVTNFSGSLGYAIVLKKKNYLFVDGRYTIQAKIECKKNFKIIGYEKLSKCKIFKNLNLGIDPALFTRQQIQNFFPYNYIKLITKNIVDEVTKLKTKKNKPFYSLGENDVGEKHNSKMNKIIKFLKKNKLDYIFITAPENVAWLLNIRGYDSPISPIPNSYLVISKDRRKFIISDKSKLKNLIKNKKILSREIITPEKVESFFIRLKKL